MFYTFSYFVQLKESIYTSPQEFDHVTFLDTEAPSENILTQLTIQLFILILYYEK